MMQMGRNEVEPGFIAHKFHEQAAKFMYRNIAVCH